jgi:ring-1,2-phenylacetyl-CoA epoxidase subunit PaaD
MSTPASPPELAAVWAALEALTDPEIPVVTLRELGILRAVRQDAQGALEVVITPTYSGCPAMGQIADDIAAVLHAQGWAGRVVTQLAPAWTTDWITDEAREKLRAYGIAPPSRCGSGLTAVASAQPCASYPPHCSSLTSCPARTAALPTPRPRPSSARRRAKPCTNAWTAKSHLITSNRINLNWLELV